MPEETEDIRRRLAAIDASHIGAVRRADGGSTASDFAFVINAEKPNQQTDEGADRPVLEPRARQSRRWIEDFDSLPNPNSEHKPHPRERTAASPRVRKCPMTDHVR